MAVNVSPEKLINLSSGNEIQKYWVTEVLSIREARLEPDERAVQSTVLNETGMPEPAIRLRGKETLEMACNQTSCGGLGWLVLRRDILQANRGEDLCRVMSVLKCDVHEK